MTRGVTLPRNRRFACSAGFTGSGAWSMPLGLIAGRLFKPFRRAISARCSPTIFSRAATLPRSSTTSASSSAQLRSGKDGGGGTSTQIVSHHAGASEKCSTARGFAPIAVAAGEAEGLRRQAGHVDGRMRLLQRLRPDTQVIGPVVPAAEGNAFLG